MRHTITLQASNDIKNQRIHCKKLPNFQQETIVKIQQDGNKLYAIYTPDLSSSSLSQHLSSLSLMYMNMNRLQQSLATMCKIATPIKSKYVEIELSQMDYNVVSNNFGLLEKSFLDQVNIIWESARIPLYYNQSNYITLMPKCTQVQLVDPYAAISFMVKNQQNVNSKQKNDQQQKVQQQQQSLEFDDKVLLLGHVNDYFKNGKSYHFGYDNILYLNKKEFFQMKKFRFGKQQQNNNDTIQFYCTVQPLLPFLSNPTFQEFRQYKRLETQKKLPQLKPILVQLALQQQEICQSARQKEFVMKQWQDKEQQIIIAENNIDFTSFINQQAYFSCTQICKLSLGLSQKLLLTQQSLQYNINHQSFQTTTMEMFIKQLSQKNKYQINLQFPEFYHLSELQLRNAKIQFAEFFLRTVKQKKQFAFLQNYCPFVMEGYVCGLVVAKLSVNKRAFQALKSFLMVKDISIATNQNNTETSYQQIKTLLQQSLLVTHDLSAQKVNQWLPVIKYLQKTHHSPYQQNQNKQQQINHNYNDDDLKFRTIFEICYKDKLTECCQFLTTETQSLSSTSPSPKLLVTTYSSNGKTYLHNYLNNSNAPLSSSQHLNAYRSWYIDCRTLINPSNRIDDIKDYLDAIVTFCPYQFLFFDNVDFMIPLIEQGDQMRQKEKIIAHVLGNYLFQLLQNNIKIAIFTAKSQANIDTTFKFNKIIKLKNPNRQLRAYIVHSLKLFNKPQNWIEEFIDKTESFSLGSLAHYIMSEEIPVKKQSKRKNDFSKIVGLENAKRVIRSVIQKPNKFGFIYDKVKIKVPRGILLYGATGNGKTALGSAVEDEFPMKYFSVKGSDILSKYIGGSEAAVREIFEKALSVAPSIIFFDEFESIVPRRNSSGTGVTDRVVNQFLCYLDGVSSTTGVFIIAASSRPDLIDPALLRPGRIDSHIYLQYPTQLERSQLLSLFNNSIKLQISDQQFVKSTANYSYSDLIGLLKELRIKQSSLILKQKENPSVQEFKYISKQLFYTTIKSYRIGTDVEQQRSQSELYSRFKQGKGPQIKKQKFIQM